MVATRNWIRAAIVLLAGSTVVFAQTVANRVSGEIDTLAAVQLAGSANPHARAANDAGSLPGDARLAGMTLHFSLTAAQQADLDALLEAQQTPGSPSYHQWLTPATYAARFGVSDSDLAKIRSWLEQQGFSIDRVATSRTSISFSGTVAQVELAFGTQIHRYVVGSEVHYANATALNIPSALSGVVGGVRNLHDFKPSPHVRLRSLADSKVSTMFTSNQSGSHYLTPKDVATLYDINAAYSAGYTGSGQSIAVMGQSKIYVTDIEAFQSAAGLTVKDPTLVLVPGSGSAAISSGDESESDLDLEYSGGIAKGATIYLVYVGSSTNYSVWDSIVYAVDTDIAPIITLSYGACETEMGSDYSVLEAILKQGAAQGQSIIASSGDDGSTSCYQDTTLTTAQRQAVVLSYPASSAYVTALGGTEFPSSYTAASNTTYWTSTSGSDVISSLRSYIPEQVWNDDSATGGLSSGGGGVSVLTTRPTWQTGVTGITSAPDYAKGYRLVPDISLDSSPANAGYLYCSSDSTSTGISGSCSNGFRDASGTYLTVAGGTSFAAPIFAGMLAIVNQKQNSTGLGLVNSTLYSLAANSATYASAFHDITTGSNACTAGSSYCSTAGAAVYSATTGYDEASGLGSIDLYNLLTAWPTTSGSTLTASSTGLVAATNTPTAGAADVITITVASASSSVTTTPTGTVALTVDGTKVTSALVLTSGKASYSFVSSNSGTHTIVATYSGDTSFAASSGTVVVTVGSTTLTGNGGSGTSTVTVTPANGYTGTVAFNLSTTSSYLVNYSCYTISSASVTGTSAVAKTLTVYLGATTCAGVATGSGGVKAFRAAPTQAVGANHTPRTGQANRIETAGFSVAGLLLAALVGWRFRRVRGLVAIAVLAVVGFTVTGCGGSSASSAGGSSSSSFSVSLAPSTVAVTAGTSGVPTGTYSVTVEGYDVSSSSNNSTATLSLTVN